MLIEHRTYTVPHGTLDTYLKRYETQALPILLRHLERLLGCFVTEVGTLNQVLHIWVYDSMADREARRARLDADPEWQAFKEVNRGSFVEQNVMLLRAASFSPRRV
ncbi:NIPSNAP family protein [Pigmentiphaga soli]|uniref:NIPSNAP family protein n=1 Tax=Pigmentiphaga soli TaxID=1007095 RepID=A0ABP8GX97_9BURK